jgi:hypothetical protein
MHVPWRLKELEIMQQGLMAKMPSECAQVSEPGVGK